MTDCSCCKSCRKDPYPWQDMIRAITSLTIVIGALTVGILVGAANTFNSGFNQTFVECKVNGHRVEKNVCQKKERNTI